MTIIAAQLRKGQRIVWADGTVENKIARVERSGFGQVIITLANGDSWVETATRKFNVK